MVGDCGGGTKTDSEANTCGVVGRSSLEGCHLGYGGDLLSSADHTSAAIG